MIRGLRTKLADEGLSIMFTFFVISREIFQLVQVLCGLAVSFGEGLITEGCQRCTFQVSVSAIQSDFFLSCTHCKKSK